MFLRLLTARDRPPLSVTTVRFETVVPVGIERAFAFFSDAENLERLTPPWLNFKILTGMPVTMREGAIIDYQISLYGIPMPWRTRIDVWEPGVCFVDRQLAGPYRWWRHEHRFEVDPRGTRIIDQVDYAPRAAAISSRLVRRDVGRIFAYRQGALPSLLRSDEPTGS